MFTPIIINSIDSVHYMNLQGIATVKITLKSNLPTYSVSLRHDKFASTNVANL